MTAAALAGYSRSHHHLRPVTDTVGALLGICAAECASIPLLASAARCRRQCWCIQKLQPQVLWSLLLLLLLLR